MAIAALEDDLTPSVFSFKSPHRWDDLTSESKRTNHWLELNYHGIRHHELWRNPVHKAGGEHTVRFDKREEGVREGTGELEIVAGCIVKYVSILTSYIIFVYFVKHNLKF